MATVLSNNPYNDTLDALWKKTKDKLHVSKHGSNQDAESSDEAQDTDDPKKSAHTKRREQVRRAQRNHRQRKENYIKTLEQELLRLRDESVSIQCESCEIAEENEILRDIMLAHGIPLPANGTPWFSPMATVSVLGNPGFGQRLHVSTIDAPPELDEVFPPGFGVPSTDPDHDVIATFNNPTKLWVPSSHLPPYMPDTPDTGPMEFPHFDSDASTECGHRPPHPYGLDATQVGVDFVLFLERCCLPHTRAHPDSDEPSGHALTMQGPLLVTAPQTLNDQTTWQIPSRELDRLFELSSALNLDGELTPVQAWQRIKEHARFCKLTPGHLRRLCEELIKEVHCFGFGAIIDEEIFTVITNELFDSI
ncbi:hypothetical protein FQN55_009117 [Onygenales sp. PD_40]|nr:hypothetical protein FQN55_009117 [Onygenales sp. PD_40]KAK2790565.1 hypothetical protein FQN53_009033 [Emmonsiellopsis sp. PD_33]